MQGSIEGGSIGVNIGGGKGTKLPFTDKMDDSCGDDIFEGANPDLRSPQLPYLTQDLWGCEREDKEFPVWHLEDEYLRITITPQWAGKVWTIYDKKRETDILFNNRAHQPANIAALKAWAAGGAEWNWSPGIIGHSAFSETQTYMARLKTSRGDVVRVYEYDRYNSTVWQVDMYTANGTFYAHPKITNPTVASLRGYWWTCVAVDATPSTRIFAPADHVAQNSRELFRNAPWPQFSDAIENASFVGYQQPSSSSNFQKDMSYLGNHQIGDMFLRISDEVYTPYIAHTETKDESGYTLVHGHPLNGTKFYTWGQSGPGRFMQDFLAGGGKRQGDYTELQTGPAPTQMQTFPVPPNSIKQWTEWFRGFNGDPEVLRGDYRDANKYITNWIKSEDGQPKSNFNNIDVWLAEISTMEVKEEDLIVSGGGWGALEEMRLGHKMAEGLTFKFPNAETDLKSYLEIQPWKELLELQTFSKDSLSRLPLSYMTTDPWLELIESSSEKDMTWLHALHLGVAYAERGDIDKPKKLFQKSIDLLDNPIAHRCLAVLQTDRSTAYMHYQASLRSLTKGPLAQDPAASRVARNLLTEIAFFLQQDKSWEHLSHLVSTPLAQEHSDLDAIVTSKAHILIEQGTVDSLDQAKTLLQKHCFPTYAAARDDLMDMWNDVVERQASLKKGSELSPREAHQARIQDPIPDNIGCVYATEYCLNYW